MKSQIYSFLIISFLFIFTNSYIVFPFIEYEEKQTKDIRSVNGFLTEYEYLNYYSDLYIGEPPQKIKVLLLSYYPYFFILNQNLKKGQMEKKIYYKTQSSSYKPIENYLIQYGGTKFQKVSETFHFLVNEGDISGIYSQKNKYFIDANKYKGFKDIKFFYSNELQKGNYFTLGIFGLNTNEKANDNQNNNYNQQIEGDKEEVDTNLLNNIIDSSDISFPVYSFQMLDKKKTKYDGNLIIGSLPHEYEPDIYFEDQYTTIKSNVDDHGNWNIPVDNSYLYDKRRNISIDTSYIKKIELNFNRRITVAPLELFFALKDSFFSIFFNEGYCTYKKGVHSSSMIVIYCIKNYLKERLRKNIPSLFLYVKNLEYTFEIDYVDLFSDYEGVDDLIFFNIAFEQNEGKIKIGQVFMKNYRFTFNPQNNQLGFYKEDSLGNRRYVRKMKQIFTKMNVFIALGAIAVVFVAIWCCRRYLNRQNKNNLSPKYFSKDIEKLEGQNIDQSYELKADNEN